MSYSVLVADDEPHARDFLVQLVDGQESVKLAGICANGNAVVKFCKTLVPDILLLDVQMPGKNGIETAKEITKGKHKPIIIFTTAYDQYAIEAFDVEAIGYLLKPFTQEQFDLAITRAIVQCENQHKVQFQERIQRLYERFKTAKTAYLDHFEIKEKGLIKKVYTSDILYISADSEYVKIHTLQSNFMYRTSLELLDQQLGPSFLRIHRSHIINLDHLQSWKYLNNGTYCFSYDNGKELTSSRSYQKAIQENL